MTIYQITLSDNMNEKRIDEYSTSLPRSYHQMLKLALPWDDLGLTPIHGMKCCMAAPGLLNGVRRMSASASSFRRLAPEGDDGAFERALHVLSLIHI